MAADAADPWLFVNDVHYNPGLHDPRPSGYWSDPNLALLESALREMHRVAPHPPVIVMAGDFLDHGYHPRRAVSTLVELAHRFNALFPHAQFVMALGNEDAGCGDYSVAPNSAFLHSVAQAWAPLVNRNGAAPDFVRTFSRDGFYTARLPLKGVRAVVIDNAYWSPFYRNPCGRGDPTPQSLAEVATALAPSKTERRWLIMHIPPGIDASSTIYRAHHLAIVPFLRPDPREAIVALIEDPARQVELVVSAHIHRFAYRIVGAGTGAPVPLLVSPAISPIFGNNPSFLSADVATDGRVRNFEEHSLDRGTWRDIGGTSTLGASEFTAPALINLQRRLSREPVLRETFAALYTGGAQWHESAGPNWRTYWCAATEFSATAFRDCVDEGGFSFLTRRGIVVVGIAAAAVLAVVGGCIALVVVAVRRRKRARIAN